MAVDPDNATVQALRSDLALQIARRIQRDAQTQVAAAKRLAIPQPTLSKIMRGHVDKFSLELLVRIAVRAELSVVLQTGRDPLEAGVYVSGLELPKPARTKSPVAEEARNAMIESNRILSSEQRLEAHVKHSELINALHRAGLARSKSQGNKPR